MSHENLSVKPTIPQESFPFMGFAAIREPEAGLRTELIDGYTVHTNLPEGPLPLEPPLAGEQPKHPYYRPLLPSAIDNLPAGEFSISNPNGPDPYYDRKITVTEDVDGKRVNSFEIGLFTNSGNSTNLMAALGYKFNQGVNRSTLVPTPQTIKHKAAELGVDIKFFPDQALIDSTSYLTAFAEGKYPVSTASARYYTHDTQDDHLTAMVLGGEPLKTALSDSATEALRGEVDADKWAGGIDEFTAYLRGTVSPTDNNSNRPYGDETLQNAGQRIGLTVEQVNEILETSRTNAQKFGMKINEHS